MELLLPAAPCARLVLIRALDCEDPVECIRALARELGAPSRLGDLGLTEAQAIAVAESTELGALAAPRPLDRSELRILLTRATRGD
jgi:alcohol dehydrogenase class IV